MKVINTDKVWTSRRTVSDNFERKILLKNGGWGAIKTFFFFSHAYYMGTVIPISEGAFQSF
jgi:hypothetical protein